jgi:hypothetical protein
MDIAGVFVSKKERIGECHHEATQCKILVMLLRRGQIQVALFNSPQEKALHRTKATF